MFSPTVKASLRFTSKLKVGKSENYKMVLLEFSLSAVMRRPVHLTPIYPLKFPLWYYFSNK